ncbi:hypothetical protein HDV00_000828 [Rhizophlyctis rosea]|nr:hypothetical protein HDV00_000828 [Rhizophlyctis rosea]
MSSPSKRDRRPELQRYQPPHRGDGRDPSRSPTKEQFEDHGGQSTHHAPAPQKTEPERVLHAWEMSDAKPQAIVIPPEVRARNASGRGGGRGGRGGKGSNERMTHAREYDDRTEEKKASSSHLSIPTGRGRGRHGDERRARSPGSSAAGSYEERAGSWGRSGGSYGDRGAGSWGRNHDDRSGRSSWGQRDGGSGRWSRNERNAQGWGGRVEPFEERGSVGGWGADGEYGGNQRTEWNPEHEMDRLRKGGRDEGKNKQPWEDGRLQFEEDEDHTSEGPKVVFTPEKSKVERVVQPWEVAVDGVGSEEESGGGGISIRGRGTRGAASSSTSAGAHGPTRWDRANGEEHVERAPLRKDQAPKPSIMDRLGPRAPSSPPEKATPARQTTSPAAPSHQQPRQSVLNRLGPRPSAPSPPSSNPASLTSHALPPSQSPKFQPPAPALQHPSPQPPIHDVQVTKDAQADPLPNTDPSPKPDASPLKIDNWADAEDDFDYGAVPVWDSKN